MQCNPVPCTWARIDGKAQTSPSGPFVVAPGKHALLAGAVGYQSASASVDVGAGATSDQTLTLTAAPPPSKSKKPATPVTQTKKEPCSKFFHTCK